MNTNTRAECPKCNGVPEFDEEGCEYTCFFCCNTGFVTLVEAAAYEREVAQGREDWAREHNWASYADYLAAAERAQAEHARRRAAAAARPVDFSDDIPF